MTIFNMSHSSAWMTKRYVFALTVIALLACSAFVALKMVIVEQETTGAVVNISGRQRMLSQRSTLFVQRMLLAADAREYKGYATELLEVVDLIEHSHKGLTKGNVELGLPSEMSETMYQMYFGGEAPLDTHMHAFIVALRVVLATDYGSLKSDTSEVQYILSTAVGPLLKSLDKVVWQYQREGEAAIEVLHQVESVVLTLTLLTLLLEALLIFRPMARQVVTQIRHLSQISEKLNCEIVEHERTEEELRKIRDELEIRVEERTTKLARKNEEMESMIYIASHDLRSPLVNIQGFGQRLEKAAGDISKRLAQEDVPQTVQDSLAKLLNERMPTALGFIKSSSEKMDTLINGLLCLSRAGRAQLNIEPLDMNAMLNQIITNLTIQIQSAEAEVTTDSLPSCLGDAAQLNQVFTNIIDNAIKYREPSRPLEIHIKGRQERDRVIYEITDNGIGIAADHQMKIWQLFHRLDPTGPVNGEGIGLTLVHRILDRLQGTIRLDSSGPDEGSCFIIELPAEESA